MTKPKKRANGRPKELPVLILLNGPSGAGKSLARVELVRRFPSMGTVLRHTTRDPRVGEEDGKDYHFVSAPLFKKLDRRHQFVGSHLSRGSRSDEYGVQYSSVYNFLVRERRTVVIDAGGCSQALRERFGERQTVLVYITADEETIAERLRRRVVDGTQPDGDYYRRLGSRAWKQEAANRSDKVVLSSDLYGVAGVVDQIVGFLREVERGRGFRIKGLRG